MLDFFLVLGQIPGTNITLTFTDVVVLYSVAFITYYLHREHKLSKRALKHLVLAFWLHVSKPRRGRPPKKVELWPEHTGLTPLINIDFANLWRLLRHAYRQAGPAQLDV